MNTYFSYYQNSVPTDFIAMFKLATSNSSIGNKHPSHSGKRTMFVLNEVFIILEVGIHNIHYRIGKDGNL